jgi:hypothetical protein
MTVGGSRHPAISNSREKIFLRHWRGKLLALAAKRNQPLTLEGFHE